MADKIVNPDDYDWTNTPSNKGQTKYFHLLDGNAREVDMRDYGQTNITNFRITLMNVARTHNLTARAKVLNDHTVLFQVTGKRL